MFIEREGIELLSLDNYANHDSIPPWIIDRIKNSLVVSLNTDYPDWDRVLISNANSKRRINILALGDVGSTLLVGLRLLGADCIDRIGIYDKNVNVLNRWLYESNQIRGPIKDYAYPHVIPIDEDSLFDCDIFLFCASRGVPPVGSPSGDVRMAQLKFNSEIIRIYARMARDAGFNGIFGVVSDPVDLLCKVAFFESNKNESSQFDFMGIASDRIIGYGLGVMNARACFYAEQSEHTVQYISEGKIFGPHGEGLIVADSIKNYNDEASRYLTDKTINANMEIRAMGFKPFIAPGLSSGALSVIATIKGQWFYGSTYMGGVYMGSKCRFINNHLEIEQIDMPMELSDRIHDTYRKLLERI